MNAQIEFIYNVVPYELIPIIYNDSTYSENFVFRGFIKNTYCDIVENGHISIYAAIRFWLTMRPIFKTSASARIMPQPLILSVFIDQLKNDELLDLITSNEYNTLFYSKLFRIIN